MNNDEYSKYPKSYSCSMSPKELGYFLFKKKKCPLCNNKMKKYKKEEYAGLQTGTDSMFEGQLHRAYEIEINYICEQCSKSYSLRELALGEEASLVKEKRKTIEEIKISDEETYNRYKKGNRLVARVMIVGYLVAIIFTLTILINLIISYK